MELSSLSPQNFLLKKFLIFFPEKTCSEKISYIFSKKSFSYISGNRTHTFQPQPSKFFPKKISYIFSQKTRYEKVF